MNRERDELHRALKALPGLKAPAGFSAAVMSAVRAKPVSPAARAAGIAALVCNAALVVFLFIKVINLLVACLSELSRIQFEIAWVGPAMAVIRAAGLAAYEFRLPLAVVGLCAYGVAALCAAGMYHAARPRALSRI